MCRLTQLSYVVNSNTEMEEFMKDEDEKKMKRANKKMDEYPNATMRVQCTPKSSFMADLNGVEQVELLGLNYSHNGKQRYYNGKKTDVCPRFKFASNDITQRAYLVFQDDAMETFVLNNKERSNFDGFIIITWISLHSHIIYMVGLMGDGNDFNLFRGKCNGKYGEQIQRHILNGQQDFGEKFLAMSDEEKSYERTD